MEFLGFTQKINGHHNYFVEKIYSGLLNNNLISLTEIISFLNNDIHYQIKFFSDTLDKENLEANILQFKPKIHTIRKGNRYKKNQEIYLSVDDNKFLVYAFTPKLYCTFIQPIKIIYPKTESLESLPLPVVWIDNEEFFNPLKDIDKGIYSLAQNDGFRNKEDFFSYFNNDFEGQIVSWTPCFPYS